MLVDSHTKSTSPDGTFAGATEPVGRDRAGTAASRGKGVAAFVVVLLAAVALYHFVGGPAGRPEPAAKAAPLVRSGDAIAVPDGSPLRAKLAIAPVIAREVPRDL